MFIDGATTLAGVMGWPVAHSLSPPMHNAAFEHLGLNWVYVPCPVAPEQVEAALLGVRGLGFAGINVTIPHKSAVLPYLDEVSRDAQLLGAANTILHQDGILHGENTDIQGFLRSVEEIGWSLTGRSVVVLGAGGSARAVCLAAIRAGAEQVIILNRTGDRAAQLADLLTPVAGETVLGALALDDPLVPGVVAAAQVVVDCTSVGMYPHHEVAPVVPGEWLQAGQLVCDLTYNPRRTVLLQAAEEAGAATLEGTGMLVHQGALALELWTGREAPVEVMRSALLLALAE
ncbi:MAG TPA: shikimate dehydrogenase [Armatimonadota bacterium]|jgi:shikimate dehydrogenase